MCHGNDFILLPLEEEGGEKITKFRPETGWNFPVLINRPSGLLTVVTMETVTCACLLVIPTWPRLLELISQAPSLFIGCHILLPPKSSRDWPVCSYWAGAWTFPRHCWNLLEAVVLNLGGRWKIGCQRCCHSNCFPFLLSCGVNS